MTVPIFSSVVTVIEIATETVVFSSIEQYQNCGFRLSVDGFSFSVLKRSSSSALAVP